MSDYEKGFHSNTSSAYFQSGSQAWAGAEAAERMRRQQADWDRQAQQQRDEQNRRANEDSARRANDARRAEAERRAAAARMQQANVSQSRNYTTAPQSRSYVTSYQVEKSSSGFNGFRLTILAGIIIISAVGLHRLMKSTPISSGPAVVANAPQLNLRSCPAANCDIITRLNKGDKVFVTKSYDNGWNAVTIHYDDGTTTMGFVNGSFLRQK